ncbi:MAG: [Fe-Fe] hydrogenase large subunit C-terminal domain-containing protein, partial [Candidatus ainarchaeum sp.]|nr:[Fe-Fe] hydrogenase large subunit C-terminal domain-containing protein [Candidatus ainarchaeum sp.]
TPLGADIATYYEALDVKERLENGTGRYPIFNSCCIGWRMYAQSKHPELLKNITIIASPQMTMGAVARFYIAKKLGRKPGDLAIVGIMPCTLKKNETDEKMKNGHRYVDYAVTTVELGQWAKARGLGLGESGDISDIMPFSSGDGMRFGVSGGMSQAVLGTLAGLMGEKMEVLDLSEEGPVKTRSFKIGKHVLNIAIVQGLHNFEKVYDEIKAGKQFHMVEVMMCPYGCVGGPGQPPLALDRIKERRAGLVKAGGETGSRTPLDNPGMKKLIDEFLGKMGRKKLEELIYFNR